MKGQTKESKDGTDYLKNALRAHLAMNLKPYHTLLGVSTLPAREISELAQLFFVPQYVRDLIRELCRPMREEEAVYISKVRLLPDGELIAKMDCTWMTLNLMQLLRK